MSTSPPPRTSGTPAGATPLPAATSHADDDVTRIEPPPGTPLGTPPGADSEATLVMVLDTPSPIFDPTRHDVPAADATVQVAHPQAELGSSAAAAPDRTPTPAPTPAPGTLPGSAAREPSTLPPASTGTDGTLRQAGRYLIRSRLGRGGMATVYRAHDPSIGRDVAVKFLHASLCEDEECRVRFLREARAAGALSHPNIVVVHDVGEIDHRPYMAMELIDGAPLSDLLDKQKTLPLRDAVVIALQLARALEYAHSRGIVHRDIKPGNMMLLRGSQTIKVADFGIAHMDDGGDQRTQVGAVLGTPQYMSPEQAKGEKLDGRSDLFSAGIVLYQMLAGERPFRGDSLVAVATRIATEEPTPLASKRPEVPASLRRVVDRCLAKQPTQRYQTGNELAEALTKVLAELNESALENDRPRIVPLRIKWALMMSIIVAVVMGLTATVITQRQYAAMMDQVSDYGASLARFIAKQNAAAVLGEEWDTVDVAVQEMMKTRNFERLSVIDLQGIVRASSLPALVGQPYKPEGNEALGKLAGNITAVRYSSGGASVLGFEAPVLFQDKQVGRVALGIPELPVTKVARLSMTLMAVLVLVTVAAVAIAMYFVANWFAKPIRLVRESMAEIGKGRFDHRIGEQRNDEFGQLFNDFDAMAQALQQRESLGAKAPATLPPPTPQPAALQPATPVPVTLVPGSVVAAAAGPAAAAQPDDHGAAATPQPAGPKS